MTWLTFTLNGRDYAVTLDTLSIAEGRDVKKYTGVTLSALVMAAAGQVDFDTLAAIVYLAKRRAGEEIDWAEIDQIDVLTLLGTVTTTTDPPEGTPEPAVPNGQEPAVKRASKPAAKTAEKPATP